MKKVLTAVAALSLVGLLGGIVTVYWTPHDLRAAAVRERSVPWYRTQVPGLPESVLVCRSGAAAASAQPIDTTVWIPLWDGMEIPPQMGISTAAESLTCIFAVVPEPGISSPAVVADTIQVTIQASMDASNPVAVTSTQGLTATQLETSSNNAVYKVVSIGRAWANNGTAPTNLQLYPYRYIRFIVTGDHAGCYRAYWKFVGPQKYTEGQPAPPRWW